MVLGQVKNQRRILLPSWGSLVSAFCLRVSPLSLRLRPDLPEATGPWGSQELAGTVQGSLSKAGNGMAQCWEMVEAELGRQVAQLSSWAE